jgi:hypothetical protein
MSAETRIARDTQRARPFLEPWETVRAAVWGFTSALGAELGYAKGRVVVVTEKRLCVLESNFLPTAFALFRIPRPTRLLAAHPIGSVSVRARGSWLWVGDERIVVQIQPGRRVRRMLAALQSKDGSDPGPAG